MKSILRLFSTAKPVDQRVGGNRLRDFFDTAEGWHWNTDQTVNPTGRAWLPSELRTKSFDDLHSLWWVLIKEQNKLYSQWSEAQRFGFHFPHKDRLHQTKLGMARIKTVLWERRIVWFQAQEILSRHQQEEKEARPQDIVSGAQPAGRKRWSLKDSKKMRFKRKTIRENIHLNWTVV